MPEIRVQASHGGRRMTLDPIGIGEFEIALPMREVETPIVAGFQVDWGEVETEQYGKISLTTGAGVGSRYGILTMDRGGDTPRYFIFDADDLLNRIVDAVTSHGAPATDTEAHA